VEGKGASPLPEIIFWGAKVHILVEKWAVIDSHNTHYHITGFVTICIELRNEKTRTKKQN